jgi:hypothetical protein
MRSRVIDGEIELGRNDSGMTLFGTETVTVTVTVTATYYPYTEAQSTKKGSTLRNNGYGSRK